LTVPSPTLIYRLTHVDNIPWILTNGLHCVNSGVKDPHFVAIGNPDLIEKRSTRSVPIPPGGVLDDYVPFYFCTHSLMLYNVHTGYNVKQAHQSQIAYLVCSVEQVQQCDCGFVFTDRHAYPRNAVYSTNPQDLGVCRT